MEQKIQVSHQLLDVFELPVLAYPSPTTDLTTLKEVVASLLVDVYNILEIKRTEPETAHFELAEDTMLVALFTAPAKPPPEPHGRAKMHHSRCTIEGEDAVQGR